MSSVKFTDEEKKTLYVLKINTIMEYYNISNEAAIYIYFRRKRSYPWRKKTDPKYLFWNARLQNALIKADSIIGFNWAALEYGKEEDALKKYGIDIATQSQNLYRHKSVDIHDNHESVTREVGNKEENSSEWTYVTRSQNKNRIKKTDRIKLLSNMGLLPKNTK